MNGACGMLSMRNGLHNRSFSRDHVPSGKDSGNGSLKVLAHLYIPSPLSLEPPSQFASIV